MSSHDNEAVVHEYDGIQELDNFLPRWWLLLLYLTTAFGLVYMVFYHVIGKGLLPVQKYEALMQSYQAEQAAIAAATPVDTNRVENAGPATDAPTLAQGQGIFTTYCVACHTPTAGGLVGPNLTDAYWLHGATYADSVRVVTEGVPEKGMISWAPILKKDQIEAVCSYVYTLRGTKPANPKNPEGVEVPGSDDPGYGMSTAEAESPDLAAPEPETGG